MRKRMIGPTGHVWRYKHYALTKSNMKIFIRLVLGLVALLLITGMSGVFGIGGFLFTLGLFAVIFFAFAG